MAYDSVQTMFKGLESYVLDDITFTNQKLGTGSYATVLKLDYMGLKCAGKKIHELLLGQEEDSVTYTVRRFKDECQILSQVRHPNLVQFLGVFFQQGDHIPILVMEYLPLNLGQCLNRRILPNEMKYSVLHDVALGLHYLHSQWSPIVHRDLSSNNVLLTSNIRAKISDLGVARILNLSPQKMTHLTKVPGTPAFMPPEAMIAEPKYDTSVDVFSYGILTIHVLSEAWPEPQVGPNHCKGGKLIPVSEAERRESFLKIIGKDHPLMTLILKCIHNDPEMRTVTGDIVERVAEMVEQHPLPFPNQLDMMEYINQLEERNEALQKKCKMEKLQEEDVIEVQTLVCSIERAIDNLKTALTDEVKRVLHCRDQSTSRKLDELKQKLSPISPTTSSLLTECMADSHPNMRPKTRFPSKQTTEERDLKLEKHKSMPVASPYQHKPVLQRSKTSKCVTESEKGAAVNDSSVSAPTSPRRGQAPPPVPPKTQYHVTSSRKEFSSKESSKQSELNISTITEQVYS